MTGHCTRRTSPLEYVQYTGLNIDEVFHFVIYNIILLPDTPNLCISTSDGDYLICPTDYIVKNELGLTEVYTVEQFTQMFNI